MSYKKNNSNTHTHTHTHIHIHTHTHTHIYTHKHIETLTHTHSLKYTHMTRTHTHTHWKQAKQFPLRWKRNKLQIKNVRNLKFYENGLLIWECSALSASPIFSRDDVLLHKGPILSTFSLPQIEKLLLEHKFGEFPTDFENSPTV